MDYNSKAFLAQRKLYTFIYPPIIIFAVTIVFYAFGGGEAAGATEKDKKALTPGFDTTIPDATNTTVVATKNEAYKQEAENKNIPSEFDFENLDASRDDTKAPPEGATTSSNNPNKDVAAVYNEYYNGSTSQSNYAAPKSQPRQSPKGTYRKPSVNEVNTIAGKEDPDHNEPIQQIAPQQQSIFYGSSKGTSVKPVPGQTSFTAVVHGDQLIGPGAVVKMRSTQSGTINGVVIPVNSFVYGVSQINNDGRALIKISSIKSPSGLISCSLNVYDSGDGQLGVYIAGGSIKNEINEEINGTSVTSTLPVIGSSIDAAKNLLRKKATKNQVKLGTNYKVVIKD